MEFKLAALELSMLCGYSFDKDAWTSAIGEQFVSDQEQGNDYNIHAVAVDEQDGQTSVTCDLWFDIELVSCIVISPVTIH